MTPLKHIRVAVFHSAIIQFSFSQKVIWPPASTLEKRSTHNMVSPQQTGLLKILWLKCYLSVNKNIESLK